MRNAKQQRPCLEKVDALTRRSIRSLSGIVSGEPERFVVYAKQILQDVDARSNNTNRNTHI